MQFLFRFEQSSAQAAYRSTIIFASTLTICVDLLATNISHYTLVICAISSAFVLINWFGQGLLKLLFKENKSVPSSDGKSL